MLAVAFSLANVKLDVVASSWELNRWVSGRVRGAVEVESNLVSPRLESGVRESLGDGLEASWALNSSMDLTNAGFVSNLELHVDSELGRGRSGGRIGGDGHDLASSIILTSRAELHLLAEVEGVKISLFNDANEFFDSNSNASEVANGGASLGRDSGAKLGASSYNSHVEDLVEENVDSLFRKLDARTAEAKLLFDEARLAHGDRASSSNSEEGGKEKHTVYSKQ